MTFLDSEFSSLLEPQLLSLGLVTLDGREHYVELDLTTEAGQARVKTSSDFVRYGGVLDLWGRVEGAAWDEWEMGRRTREWLLGLAAESGTRVEVAFDCPTDYELMEYVIRDSGLWDRVREVVVPTNVNLLTGTINGELAAEKCFRTISKRGLRRHHALADAFALRAAYIAVNGDTMAFSRFVHTPEYQRLVVAAAGGEKGDMQWESWLRQWLMTEARALDGRRPIDVVQEPGGLEQVEGVLIALAYGTYL